MKCKYNGTVLASLMIQVLDKSVIYESFEDKSVTEESLIDETHLAQ